MNLENQIQRFEQQLDAFEQLHADELKGFEKKLVLLGQSLAQKSFKIFLFDSKILPLRFMY